MNEMQMEMAGGLTNGSLGGHAFPGVIFLEWGLYWLAELLRTDPTNSTRLESSLVLPLGKALYGAGADPMVSDGKGIALLLFSWHLLAVFGTMVLLHAAASRGVPA